MSIDLPVIRLTVERLQHSIVAALSPEMLNPAIEEATEKAIQDLDLDKMVRREVGDAVTNSLHRYFNYGAGREMLDVAINRGLEQLVKDRQAASMRRLIEEEDK